MLWHPLESMADSKYLLIFCRNYPQFDLCYTQKTNDNMSKPDVWNTQPHTVNRGWVVTDRKSVCCVRERMPSNLSVCMLLGVCAKWFTPAADKIVGTWGFASSLVCLPASQLLLDGSCSHPVQQPCAFIHIFINIHHIMCFTVLACLWNLSNLMNVSNTPLVTSL